MASFYWHITNEIAQKLKEVSEVKGFLYTNRYEMELKIQKYLAEAGYDIWPTFHTVLGSLAGQITDYIELNPEDPLDDHSIKLCRNNHSAWCFVRIANGPRMSTCVGWCSSGANNPFALSTTQMAQAGIIRTSFVPRAM